jgi:ureidoglycolate hydrolase
MPDMIPVKIRPLSGEAFRPYGQVLERGGLVYPDTDDGRVAMELLQVRRRPDANQIAQLGFPVATAKISHMCHIYAYRTSMIM